MRIQQFSDTSDTVRRYNADTVRQVLARATELEQAEQDQLSSIQIEELGRELGLKPETIRRALGEVERGTITVQQVRKRPFLDAIMPGLLYAMALSLFIYCSERFHWQSPVWLQIGVSFVPPFLIALVNGWRQHRLWLGLVGGVVITLLSLLAICIAYSLATGRPAFSPGDVWGIFMITTMIGAIGGVLGDYARRQYDSRKVRQQLAQQR